MAKSETLTPENDRTRRAYFAAYRDKNRDHLNKYHRDWAKANPDKVKAIQTRYRSKKALKAKTV